MLLDRTGSFAWRKGKGREREENTPYDMVYAPPLAAPTLARGTRSIHFPRAHRGPCMPASQWASHRPEVGTEQESGWWRRFFYFVGVILTNLPERAIAGAWQLRVQFILFLCIFNEEPVCLSQLCRSKLLNSSGFFHKCISCSFHHETKQGGLFQPYVRLN